MHSMFQDEVKNYLDALGHLLLSTVGRSYKLNGSKQLLPRQTNKIQLNTKTKTKQKQKQTNKTKIQQKQQQNKTNNNNNNNKNIVFPLVRR